jgi:RecA-family ATPase
MTDRQAQRLLGATGKALNRPLDGEDANLGWGDDCLPIFDMTKLDGPEPDPVTFALDKFIPETEVTLFTGEGGVGKSLCAQQLATCMAAKLPFLGLSTSIRGDDGVLYVTAEEGADELERRQRAINRMLGLQRLDIDDLLHLSSLRGKEGNELCTFDAEGKIQPTPAFRKLSHTICRGGIGTVILDNVAHLFGGNENDRRQVTAFVNLLYKLVRIYHCTIVLIGHPNKSGDSYSGSTAWLNAVRSQIFLERIEDENGHEPDPNRRVIVNPKANYAPSQQRLTFRWHEGAFWLDDELPEDTRKVYADIAKANSENDAFRRCLAATNKHERAVSHNPGVNYYATIFPKMPEGKGFRKDAFERAFERLLHLGEIEVDAKLWKRENRTWKFGIRPVDNADEKCTDPPHQPPAQTPSQTIENACTDPHAPTPIYTTYINRAGPPNGPPPDLDDEGVEY